MSTIATQLEQNWTIDGKIKPIEICIREDWHRASVVDAFKAEGLNHEDAEAFTDWAFASVAVAKDTEPEDCLTDAQWERLS